MNEHEKAEVIQLHDDIKQAFAAFYKDLSECATMADLVAQFVHVEMVRDGMSGAASACLRATMALALTSFHEALRQAYAHEPWTTTRSRMMSIVNERGLMSLEFARRESGLEG